MSPGDCYNEIPLTSIGIECYRAASGLQSTAETSHTVNLAFIVCTYLKGDTKSVLLIRGTYLLSGLVYVHEVYTGTE